MIVECKAAPRCMEERIQRYFVSLQRSDNGGGSMEMLACQPLGDDALENGQSLPMGRAVELMQRGTMAGAGHFQQSAGCDARDAGL